MEIVVTFHVVQTSLHVNKVGLAFINWTMGEETAKLPICKLIAFRLPFFLKGKSVASGWILRLIATEITFSDQAVPSISVPDSACTKQTQKTQVWLARSWWKSAGTKESSTKKNFKIKFRKKQNKTSWNFSTYAGIFSFFKADFKILHHPENTIELSFWDYSFGNFL